MAHDYVKPEYKMLVKILEEAAKPDRISRSYPSGYGIDVGDIDIAWLYERLTDLGANLREE